MSLSFHKYKVLFLSMLTNMRCLSIALNEENQITFLIFFSDDSGEGEGWLRVALIRFFERVAVVNCRHLPPADRGSIISVTRVDAPAENSATLVQKRGSWARSIFRADRFDIKPRSPRGERIPTLRPGFYGFPANLLLAPPVSVTLSPLPPPPSVTVCYMFQYFG